MLRFRSPHEPRFADVLLVALGLIFLGAAAAGCGDADGPHDRSASATRTSPTSTMIHPASTETIGVSTARAETVSPRPLPIRPPRPLRAIRRFRRWM